MTLLFPAAHYPEILTEDFSGGIGHWGASGSSQVVGGIFSSSAWSYDVNHLAAHGGPGMLHLLAYANWPIWNYQTAEGSFVASDFTNARVEARARGVNFNPNGSEFIAWIQARHPYVADKYVNWGFISEPRTSQLASGNWEGISWRLEPDPAKWVWGRGANGGYYDTFLSLQESLQNIYNFHLVMIGPDNVGHPSGSFELDEFSIAFNRNGPGLSGPMWDAAAKSSPVSLSNGNLTAEHGPFTSTCGVRGNVALKGKRYWETKHVSGDVTKCFVPGVCNANYNPALHGGTLFADTSNGWGFLTERAAKRHNGVANEVSWGSVISAGVTMMHAFDETNGSYWIGVNGTFFEGGNPAAGTNPMFIGLTGDIYPIDSNGTSNASWVWRANFSGPFEYTPPSGFSGLAGS